VSEPATEIDVAGATAALEERLAPSRETIEVAREAESGRFTNSEEVATPAAGDEAGEVEAPATPEGTEAAASQEGAETPFTHIPDEALSPEMLAVKRAMQADYTRKTQEIAEYRKLAEEFEVESADELRQRLEIQRQLADPENWPKLHEELTGYLQSQGLAPRVADEAAAVALGQAIDFGDEDDGNDPFEEIPPALAQRLAAMEKQQNDLVQLLYAREQQAQEEARFAELARNLTTQENQIRAKYAEQWGEKADEYVEAVYDLAGDSGDLSVGLTRLETMLGYDASRYLLGKEEARRAPGPVVGEGVIAVEGDEAPHTLEEGHARAMEYIRAQAAAEAGL
jgi:hypothetical protein